MIDNSWNERRPWSHEQDDALRELYDTLQANRWNHIAERLEAEYGFTGRSGKQCRQRYNNHLDPSLSKDEWSHAEELALFRLHDQLGNKWAVISQRLNTNRTDNAVKNHFYSRLRKTLRRLNKVICEKFKKTIREIKPQVLYKIIEASEQAFKPEPMCSSQLSHYGCELKNRILMLDDEEEQQGEAQIKALIEMIHHFNHSYKRKPKKLRRSSTSYSHAQYEHQPQSTTNSASTHTFTAFFSLDNVPSLACYCQAQKQGKIQIRSQPNIKTQTQKIISPIILTANSTSLRIIEAERTKNSEQVLSALGLLEEEPTTPTPRLAEPTPQPQFKLNQESSAEPIGNILGKSLSEQTTIH